MLDGFRFHHIGIAVNNIDETAHIYLSAGYERTDTVYDPIQNVYICFLTKKGMPMLELLEPHDVTSPIFKLLQKNGVTPYHVCYEVDSLEDSVGELRKMRYVATSVPVLAVAIDNRRVCFLYHKKIGLIELVESNK